MSEEKGLRYLAWLASTREHEVIFAYVPSAGFWQELTLYAPQLLNLTVHEHREKRLALCATYPQVHIFHTHAVREILSFMPEWAAQGGQELMTEWRQDREIRNLPGAQDLGTILATIDECHQKNPDVVLSFGVVSARGDPLVEPNALTEKNLTAAVVRFTPDTFTPQATPPAQNPYAALNRPLQQQGRNNDIDTYIALEQKAVLENKPREQILALLDAQTAFTLSLQELGPVQADFGDIPDSSTKSF